MKTQFTCPNCGSGKELLVYSMMAYYVNTGDFFCESVKPFDSDSPASCLECDWKGYRKDLVEVPFAEGS